MTMTREERLMPNDVPRYIRCYHLSHKSEDYYTIVFTRMGRTGSNRYSHKGKGYPYFSAIGSNGKIIATNEAEHPTRPVDKDPQGLQFHTYKKVDFSDLPAKVRQHVRDIYIRLWKI